MVAANPRGKAAAVNSEQVSNAQGNAERSLVEILGTCRD